MSELTNMALPKPKKGEKSPDNLSSADQGKEPKYPWGLELHLDDAAIKKLGLKLKDFDTDTVVRLEARAECTRVSEDDTRNGGKTQSLDFQITDMNVAREGEDAFAKGWEKGDGPDKAGARKPAGGKG